MIRLINLYSNNSKLAYIHPVEKIIIVLFSLIGCSYTKNIYIIVANIFLFLLLNIIAKNPLVIVKKFISVAFIFTVFTSITMFWQGQSISLILLVVLRGINGAITLSFLALTTPINHIVAVISKFEYTRDIADIINQMERFIMLLEEDFNLTFKAIRCRGGFSSFRKSVKDYGLGFGIIFKNLISRWREINISLKNRNYRGRHNYSFNFKFNKIIISLVVLYFILLVGFIIAFK
ncbi:MAG: energy-coupling factor transporter transmembrane component T family protein [Clostridium sp.]|uniref:energy-coupling factor transporter transmembrane component T family protein n=1 Tax=Clostridium sp. TaxID=1506 RepID=UPI003F2F1971